MVPPSFVTTPVEKLRLDLLPFPTKNAFLRCIELPLFQQGGWYLAGGTALALQAGHRQSVDLDFFTAAKSFDTGKLAALLADVGDWNTTSADEGTLYGEFLGAKLSFIAYPSFTPAEPMLAVGGVNILTAPDIAAMKVVAISQRGRKRDFVDLYWLCHHGLPLAVCLARAHAQYTIRQNPNHLLKSLVYFEDAEDDPEPVSYVEASWNEIKSFFKKEVAAIAARTVGLS